MNSRSILVWGFYWGIKTTFLQKWQINKAKKAETEGKQKLISSVFRSLAHFCRGSKVTNELRKAVLLKMLATDYIWRQMMVAVKNSLKWNKDTRRSLKQMKSEANPLLTTTALQGQAHTVILQWEAVKMNYYYHKHR